MADHDKGPPPAEALTEMDPSHAVTLLNLADEAFEATVTPSNQPIELTKLVTTASPVSNLRNACTRRLLANGSKANSDEEAEMGGLSGVIDNSHGNKYDAVGTGNNLLFQPFPYLPAEIRVLIWQTAAEAAKPQGVYRFKVKNRKLGLLAGQCQVSQALATNMRRLRPDGDLARSIRDLMLNVYLGDTVTTLDPLPDVDNFTRDIRNLLRSCPEARSELMRTEPFSSSFSFYWIDGDKCDLGVIRPFCYETDWIGLTGMSHNSNMLLPAPGRVCTPDLFRTQNLAIPYHEYSGFLGETSRAHLQALHVFPSLKSLGLYEPCFWVNSAAHWSREISKNQRYFLKGVSTSLPDTTSEIRRPPSRQRLTCHSFRRAMLSLKSLIVDVMVMAAQRRREMMMAALKRREGRKDAGTDLAGLQFCFLLHAMTQEGLDLMKFREDGSHLGDGTRIEDLGELGRRVKDLQTNERDNGPC